MSNHYTFHGDIKKYTIDGHEFTFICRFRNTSSGFAHDVELFHGTSSFLGKYTAHYLNRTWESYAYQTAMLAVVRNQLDHRELCAREQFKRENGFSRLSAKRRPELEAFIAKQREEVEIWRTLAKLYEQLK